MLQVQQLEMEPWMLAEHALDKCCGFGGMNPAMALSCPGAG